MTTFWLSFNDPEATAEKRFLGVAIFDMDESAGELSVNEIAKHAWDLGLNRGGAVLVQEISGAIPLRALLDLSQLPQHFAFDVDAERHRQHVGVIRNID